MVSAGPPLRVAPCPRCTGPIVFGERMCAKCGQTFDYGPNAPPVPSLMQVSAALSALAAGQGAPQQRAPAQPAPPAVMDLDLQELPPPARTHPGEQLVGTLDVPELPGLDTGRAARVGSVNVEDIPGFQESSIFAAMTPDHVNTQAVVGLETTAQVKVGDVFAAPQPSGLFHSDFMKAPEGVPTQQIDGIEGHPTSGTRSESARAKRKDARDAAEFARTGIAPKRAELPKATCRCGVSHRFDRCPSCGTLHPDLREE